MGALIAASAGGCGTGTVEEASGLDAPDMQLEARYAVSVDVVEQGEGCVVGGLTPLGGQAEATVAQNGAVVVWSQAGLEGVGRQWNLSGHVCPATGGASPHMLRLFGGRIAQAGEGDAFCQVEMALPAAHAAGTARTRNRCEDARCAALELVDDGCGGWVAHFEARMGFLADCAEQPTCVMRMRWHATPISTDAGCMPDPTAGDAWLEACGTLP